MAEAKLLSIYRTRAAAPAKKARAADPVMMEAPAARVEEAAAAPEVLAAADPPAPDLEARLTVKFAVPT